MPRNKRSEYGLDGLRQKLLHSKGVVASVKYVYDSERHGEHEYTGLFRGADYGVVRLSETGFLLSDIEKQEKYSPSMALKFLVDGKISENLLAMVSFDGVADPYFFANPFTNHPPKTQNECMKKTAERKQNENSGTPFSIGTSNFSGVEQDGEFLDEDEMVFPYELVYEPNTDFFTRHPDSEDFLEYFDTMLGPNYVPEVDDDGNDVYPILFTIKARRDPGDELQTIGEIQLTSNLFRSKFGDEALFFRHERFRRDLTLMKRIDDDVRREKWAQAAARRESLDTYKNDEIIELPDDQEQAKEIIEQGIIQYGCPFAWMLPDEFPLSLS